MVTGTARQELIENTGASVLNDPAGEKVQQAVAAVCSPYRHRTTRSGAWIEEFTVLNADGTGGHLTPIPGLEGVPGGSRLADIEDLGPSHSLHAEPGVRSVRAAADLAGVDVWIAVTIPAGFEGAQGDPAPGIDVIGQWTSVVLHPGELTWLREALALNAAAGQDLD